MQWRYQLDSDTWFYEPTSPGVALASVFIDNRGWHANLLRKDNNIVTLGPYENRIATQEEVERYFNQLKEQSSWL
jgi:hypothetical protein